MSDTPTVGQQVQSGSSAVRSAPVRASIARAAQATGVDFNYLLAQAKLESSLNPNAKAGTSSAAGLYQFTNGTWLSTLDRHGAEHGLGWAGAAISGGRVSDPAMRAQIMALRYDADASALMAGELAADNRAELATALGREPDAAELYLGHFLGVGGASTFLSALATDPGQSAARLMPAAAAANRSVFYGPEGARSLSGVMDHIRGRMGAAMEAGGPEMWAAMGSAPEYASQFTQFAGAGATAAAIPAGGPIAREFQGAQAQLASALPQSAGRSMADTLNASFGAGTAAPAHVRNAYAKLARFGL